MTSAMIEEAYVVDSTGQDPPDQECCPGAWQAARWPTRLRLTGSRRAGDEQPRRRRVPIERLKVVPRRALRPLDRHRPTLLLLFLFVKAMATNPAFGWSIAGGYLFHPSIMRGLGRR